MRQIVRRWFGDRGAAAVEYAVLLALIAVVCVGGLTYLGTRAYASLSDAKLTTAVGDSTTSTTVADDEDEDEDEDDDEVTTTTTRPRGTTTTTRAPTTTTTRPTTTTTRPSTTTTTRCRGRRC